MYTNTMASSCAANLCYLFLHLLLCLLPKVEQVAVVAEGLEVLEQWHVSECAQTRDDLLNLFSTLQARPPKVRR